MSKHKHYAKLPADSIIETSNTSSLSTSSSSEEEEAVVIPPKRVKEQQSFVNIPIQKPVKKRKIIYDYDYNTVNKKQKYDSSNEEEEIPVRQKKQHHTKIDKEVVKQKKPPSLESTPSQKSEYYTLSKKIRDYGKKWFSTEQEKDVKTFQNAIVHILCNDNYILNQHQDMLLRDRYLVKLQNILGVKSTKNKDDTRTFHMKDTTPTIKNVVRNIKKLPDNVILEISHLMKKMKS